MEDENKNAVEEPIALYDGEYTYADYLKFEFEEMVELIRGKIFKMSPAPNSNHQQVSMLITKVLLQQKIDKTCQLFAAPFDVILPVANKKNKESNTVVQPDLCVICDASKINKTGCFGAPDLIIEIISPSTSKKDLHDKYSVYEESGVREYWTVFPGEEVIVIYVLENGVFVKVNVFGNKDVLRSTIFPELEIEVRSVFPEEECD